MFQTIPLNKLVASPRNVRRHGDPSADAELKASIAAHGLLQNLVVRAGAKGKFEVEAGERRRKAMLALVEDKVLPPGHEVTCLVLGADTEVAHEASLAENFHRLAMNPADEAQAFATLIEGGASTEQVARRFGLTVRFVEGRLRLATLAPVVFDALAAGEITLDMAKAYGATSDQQIQARVFTEISGAYYSPTPDSIRRMVLTGTVRGSDPRAKLVGRDAYLAAGGRIERELFDNADTESWVDVALLESLAAAKMEEEARALAAQNGLAWVKPTLDPYASHDLVEGLVRLPAEPAPLSETEVSRLEELDTSWDEHAAILEDEDSAPEAIEAAEAAIAAIERETQDIRNRPPVLAEKCKGNAGMILTLSREGKPVLQPVFYGEPEAPAEGADDGIEVVSSEGDNGGCRSAYAAEELIAELSSAMLGAELGLPVAHLDSHASYIEHWLELLKEDDRAILTAAAKAEEAAGLLLRLGGRSTPEGTPVVFAGGRSRHASEADALTFGNNIWATLDRVRDRVPDMVLIHGGDTKGADRIASSWAERRSVPQVTFSLDMKLGARAGFKRNERMLSLDPRYVVAFPGNGVLERLVIEAKARRITVVDRRGPLGTNPKAQG